MSDVIHPKIKWGQRAREVRLSISPWAAEVEKIEFTEDSVKIRLKTEENTYAADLDLYAEIDTERSNFYRTEKSLFILLAKQAGGSWMRLTRIPNSHVTTDFEYLMDEDDEDEAKMSDLPVSKLADGQLTNPSADLDADLSDDELEPEK
ncbi:CS domain-containing protein [Streptomyces sp. NPDC127069]|uniref:CS domain-containing protein n=1 Tax=Streptomyces sp. NPDC127069 TaxID=3347128 RepID=UPI0036545E85